MKKLRKVNKEKRKQARKKLKSDTNMFLDHPKECCVCKTEFERNHETVKTWHVTVVEKRVRLTCPDCWEVFGKIKEELENEG